MQIAWPEENWWSVFLDEGSSIKRRLLLVAQHHHQRSPVLLG